MHGQEKISNFSCLEQTIDFSRNIWNCCEEGSRAGDWD